jgi:hypothetical protein
MSEVGQREKAGSHRIEMDVVDQSQQRASLLNKDALITALEHVSPLAVEAVKAVGEGSLQPRHAIHPDRRQIVAFRNKCPSTPLDQLHLNTSAGFLQISEPMDACQELQAIAAV